MTNEKVNTGPATLLSWCPRQMTWASLQVLE